MTQSINAAMSRWIWIVIAFCVSTAVYFTIRYGLRPKPIPVMNPTQFESPDQIGVVVYKRLRQNIRAERVVVLGSSSNSIEDEQIWSGLRQAALADKEDVEILLFKKDEDRAQFLENVQQAIKSKKLVLVIGPTEEVSHLVPNSLTKDIERLRKHPVLSVSIQRLAITSPEYDDLQTQCLDGANNDDGLKKLECASQRVARKYLKRKLAPDQIWAVMERHGLKEYLLFVHRPVSP